MIIKDDKSFPCIRKLKDFVIGLWILIQIVIIALICVILQRSHKRFPRDYGD